MIKYIKATRRRFMVFGLLLSVGVFFLCTTLSILDKNFGNLGLVIGGGLLADNAVYNMMRKQQAKGKQERNQEEA